MSILFIVIAFCSGVFGALLGGLQIFILSGIAAIVGASIAMAGGADLIVGNGAFGILFGPHIAFMGGVASMAYASKKGYNENGANILENVVGSKDIKCLLVGGLFAAIGYLLTVVFSEIGLPTDNIALSVFVNCMLIRFIIGKTGAFGKVAGGLPKKYMTSGKTLTFDMFWGAATGALIGGFVYIIAEAAGMEAAGSVPAFVWGCSVVSLAFLPTGVVVPGSHHVTISAALGALGAAKMFGIGMALPLVGLVFGLIAVLLGDFAACSFNSDADTYIDPPAFGIFICTTLYLFIF